MILKYLYAAFFFFFTFFTLFLRVFEGNWAPTYWTKFTSCSSSDETTNNLTAIHFWESLICNHVNIVSKQAIQNHKNIHFIHKLKLNTVIIHQFVIKLLPCQDKMKVLWVVVSWKLSENPTFLLYSSKRLK